MQSPQRYFTWFTLPLIRPPPLIRPLSPAILDRVSGAHNTHSLHSLLPTQGKVTKAQGTEHGRKNTIGPKKKKKKDTQNLSKENISHAP